MQDYRRYRVPGGTYFFSVNLLERRLDTLVRHIDILREAVRKTRRVRSFHIDAWVVLPDHMNSTCMDAGGRATHGVVAERLDATARGRRFSNRWKSIKLRFVQAIPRTERRSSVRIAKSERGI